MSTVTIPALGTETPRLYTKTAAARCLGISRPTLDSYIARGLVQTCEMLGRTFIRRAELARLGAFDGEDA